MEALNLQKLIEMLSFQNMYEQALAKANQKYLVKIYKVAELKPCKIVELYEILQKKFYFNRKTVSEESWFENELRIFIWLLIGYLYVFKKQLLELQESDWSFFSSVFNYRSIDIFQYQGMSLLKLFQKTPKWTVAEIELLKAIIYNKKMKNKWNSIARQLFIRSNKKYYRNPKQCRERWMNHLDPAIIHSDWNNQEDFILLASIQDNGKKWSSVVKELGSTRTEHMVKNRYKSLISNESKKHPNKKQVEIQNMLIDKLKQVGQIVKSSEQNENIESERQQEEEQQSEKDKFLDECKEEYFEQIEPLQLGDETHKRSVRKASETLLGHQQHEEHEMNARNMLNQDSMFINHPIFMPWRSEQIHLHLLTLDLDAHKIDQEHPLSEDSNQCYL